MENLKYINCKLSVLVFFCENVDQPVELLKFFKIMHTWIHRFWVHYSPHENDGTLKKEKKSYRNTDSR